MYSKQCSMQTLCLQTCFGSTKVLALCPSLPFPFQKPDYLQVVPSCLNAAREQWRLYEVKQKEFIVGQQMMSRARFFTPNKQGRSNIWRASEYGERMTWRLWLENIQIFKIFNGANPQNPPTLSFSQLEYLISSDTIMCWLVSLTTRPKRQGGYSFWVYQWVRIF